MLHEETCVKRGYYKTRYKQIMWQVDKPGLKRTKDCEIYKEALNAAKK